MRIVPVIDLAGGAVVRGIAGRRSEYRPVAGRLSCDATVGGVARGLRAAFGFDECYLADLDAIGGSPPAFASYDEAAAAGLRLQIDAGTTDARRALELAHYFDERAPGGRIIAGLESLPDLRTLEAIVAAVGADRLTFSLDLKQGQPLGDRAAWGYRSPCEIVAAAVAVGVRSVIVLDLAGVGLGQGVPTVELCRRLRADHPTLEITTGGGVRDLGDLHLLREAGCDAVLVAAALHDGRLSPDDVHAFNRG